MDDKLIQLLTTKLRDKNTPMAEFRAAADKLALVLVHQAAQFLHVKQITVTTPLEQSAQGTELRENIVLVPILRSGLALLPAFLQYFPHARVGFVGLKRDEKTAIAHLYYKKLPPIKAEDQVLVLDPMIATGGSGASTLKIVTELGIRQEQIIFIGVIAATPGIEEINHEFPHVKVIVACRDQKLNAAKYIVPGLGDFGDRYFGSE